MQGAPAIAEVSAIDEEPNIATTGADAGAEPQEQGPHALTGVAAAEEEASAQQRLTSTPAEPTPRRGVRGLLRRALETYMPATASLVLAPQPEYPSGFEPQLAVISAYSDEECAICLATLGSCVTTPCGHSFHAACLEHYFNGSRQPGQRSRCPLCRSSVHAPLPLEVRSVSGLPIEAVGVPENGGRCHFDRPYRFLHLGGFARPSILYLMSSNEDRKTSHTQPMWIITANVRHPPHAHANEGLPAATPCTHRKPSPSRRGR